MDSRQGGVGGASLLVAGSCIGAGMLGLPVLSAMAGFVPSVAMFCVCWAFMTCTGLLLLEVNLWFSGEASLISMAGRTLGVTGKGIAWVTFLFLFYCLNVAYLSGMGALFSDFSADRFGYAPPHWVGSLLFVLFFGLFIYLGTRAVDRCNRLLMAGLIVAYLALVGAGSFHVKMESLMHRNWPASILVIPAMILSFGFHNLVPSLTTYLQHDARKLRKAILLGSTLSLAIYLVWHWIILGIIPYDEAIKEALDEGDMATQVLRNTVGASWVVNFAHNFAFFAIVTSFVGVALSFVDFLADGLKVKKTAIGKLYLVALALLPPFLFSVWYPSIFLTMLRYAGGFGAVILFGLLPALMVWIGRYRHGLDSVRLVPGGRFTLILIMAISIGIVVLQFAQEVGWITSQILAS